MDIDYTKQLPQDVPEGMLEYYVDKGYLNKNAIIYLAENVKNPLTNEKEAMVKLRCSACGGEMYARRVDFNGCRDAYATAKFGFIHPESNENMIAYDNTYCPMCGERVKVYHAGNMYQGRMNLCYINPLSITRIGNDIAILQWRVSRYVTKSAGIQYETKPIEGYIFNRKKCIKVISNGWYQYIYHTGQWYQLKRCTDQMGLIKREMMYNFDKNILEGTALENSKLDIYLKSGRESYPITYLRVYQKHRNVENLVMQGGGSLVTEAITDKHEIRHRNEFYADINGINLQEKSPFKMIGLNRNEFNFAKKEKWSLEDIDFYKEGKEKGISAEFLNECRKEEYYSVRKLFKQEFENNIPRAIRYIQKQRNICKDNSINTQYLIDYWNMKDKLGESVKNLKDRYPQNIINAHNTVVWRQKFESNPKLQKDFEKRYSELLKYSFDDGRLLIVPAKDDHELYCEGRILGHCVYNYSEKHATGKTAIFFIRHSNEPEKPYFTLELDERNLTVVQNRGKHNCARADEVVAFEKKWLDHIKTMKEEKNAKRNNQARKSA